jgi:deoxyadenosine/deoxycytidine kinase
MKPGLIAIAGLIGVGKTTLAHSLTNYLDAHLILEEYDLNPFLARQMAGDKKLSLPSELFFLFSRARQLDIDNIKSYPTVVCDYIFDKNRIFARLNLNDNQFAIYDHLEKTVVEHLATPDIVIHLTDTVENCMSRIASRGRTYESSLTRENLTRLAQAYETLFQNWTKSPVIKINCADRDLRRKETVLHITSELLQKRGHSTFFLAF